MAVDIVDPTVVIMMMGNNIPISQIAWSISNGVPLSTIRIVYGSYLRMWSPLRCSDKMDPESASNCYFMHPFCGRPTVIIVTILYCVVA